MATMGVKVGTKMWDDRPRETAQKSDGKQTMGADAREKEFGGDDLGTVLNKISDPNFVDTSKRVRGVGNSKLDKDAFLKMMLAQLKNQDPTNPLKSHEMAAQMAQFSGVEQMANMNKALEEIRDGQKPGQTYQVLNYLGKAVAGDSAKLVRVKNDKDHEVGFDLPADTSNVTIKVRNAAGDIVRKVDLKNLKKGPQSWVWNGQNEMGITQPAGEYSFIYEAKGKDGRKLAVKTDFEGVITGVNHTAEGPVLLVGSQTVRLRDVKKIVDPALVRAKKPTPPLSSDQNLKTNASPDLKKVEGAPENEPKVANGLSNVVMSREMLEKLEREMGGPGNSSEPREAQPLMVDKPAVEPKG